MNNFLSYCGLVDPRISASDKDLPVPTVTSLEVGEKSKVSILEVVALWGNVGIFPQSMGHIDI